MKIIRDKRKKSINNVKVSCYLLDEDKDLELVREETFTGDSYSLVIDMMLYSAHLIVIEKVND